MVDTAEHTPGPSGGPPGRAATTWGDRVRFVVRGLGQTLITLGVVVLLFVVYEVYVTNYIAEGEQKDVRTALSHKWETDTVQGRLALPGSSTPKLPDGQGIAFLYIPRLGRDYSFAIVQGTNGADLEKGPGHYVGTALPGQVGNFAVAGHRVGKGEPFLNLDHLRSGDAVIVQTQTTWFVYQVLGVNGDLAAKDPKVDDLPGREIVLPSDGDVLDPVPDHPGQQPKYRLMTMTTCHPKFTASHRMVVYSKLAKTYKATDGQKMPAAVAAYYTAQES